jgi:AraC-like DNA-binding protein
MSFVVEGRTSDSPYLKTITHGYTAGNGTVIRPAETHWHMVLMRHLGEARLMVVGPWATSGEVSFGEGAELLWIKFTLGTFMPHLPTKTILNSEISLPGATSRSFWLNSSAWEFPDHANVETFIERLVRKEVLVRDPVIDSALQDQQPDIAERTIRYRFLRATGLTQSHIRQHERALQAARLLQQGVSILDTVYEAGYYDQPHLTRALKQFLGHTPAQIATQP